MQIDLSKKSSAVFWIWFTSETGFSTRPAGTTALRITTIWNPSSSRCAEQGMDTLVERYEGTDVPSRAFSDGGIHEAIMDYEDTVFYEILAEELARRDMEYQPVSNDNYEELVSAWTTTLRNSRPTGRTIFSFPTWISHNRKRQCRIGHWRFYVSALSGGAPVWVCAERLQGADRLSGGQGMESTYKLSV